MNLTVPINVGVDDWGKKMLWSNGWRYGNFPDDQSIFSGNLTTGGYTGVAKERTWQTNTSNATV
jgi:hypothetical protein